MLQLGSKDLRIELHHKLVERKNPAGQPHKKKQSMYKKYPCEKCEEVMYSLNAFTVCSCKQESAMWNTKDQLWCYDHASITCGTFKKNTYSAKYTRVKNLF